MENGRLGSSGGLLGDLRADLLPGHRFGMEDELFVRWARKIDSLVALVVFGTISVWKCHPRQRFWHWELIVWSSGGLLGDLGLEMFPRASFWQGK